MSKILYQLFVGGTTEGSVGRVVLTGDNDVIALREAVFDRRKDCLGGAPENLEVYEPGTDVPVSDGKEQLTDDALAALFNKKQHVVVVGKSRGQPPFEPEKADGEEKAMDAPSKAEPTADFAAFLACFTPEVMTGLSLLAAEAITRKRTLVLSEATMTRLADMMNSLQLPTVGASWLNKPSKLPTLDAFQWLPSDEDSKENREAYMAHLHTQVNLPNGYSMADVKPSTKLLDVTLPIAEGQKISGTTDVVIAKLTNIQNSAIRNQVEALLELKKPENMQRKDHNPRTVGEFVAASYLNINHGLVSMLTDLGTCWTVYWLGRMEDGSGVALHKLVLDNEEEAGGLAKYILESLNNKARRDSLPTGFADRLSFQDLFESYAIDDSSAKRLKTSPGGSGGFGSDGGKPSSQRGKNPPSGPKDSRSSESGMDGQDFVAPSAGDGPSQMDYTATLRRFAFQPNNDVADELDLLDMVDEREQHEIIRAFAMKNMVPYMTASFH